MIQRLSPLIKKAQLNTNQAGFSIVEIVVASAVFSLIVTALFGALLYSNKSAETAGTRARAVFLAEEGLEAARNIRDENFDNLFDGIHGLAAFANQWHFSGMVNDIVDIFTRQIEISTVDSNTKQIVSRVFWDVGLMNKGSVSLTTRLTNWQIIVQAVSSCSGFCQSLGYTGGTCRQVEQRCVTEGEIYEAEGDQYCTEGQQADTCCCAP